MPITCLCDSPSERQEMLFSGSLHQHRGVPVETHVITPLDIFCISKIVLYTPQHLFNLLKP